MQTFPDLVQSSEIPSIPVARNMREYQYFANLRKSSIADNAFAYTNKKSETSLFRESKIKKVLTNATFIPAHPSRFQAGGFVVENMKYFVVHRPGYGSKPSSLLNVLWEFSTQNRQAATHFVIGLNGELVQMVDLTDVAYHCGDSAPATNANSVGAELEGGIGDPFTEAQYKTLASLLRVLDSVSGFLTSQGISDFPRTSKSKILGHSEIRHDKPDPGPNFNYAYLATAFLGAQTPAPLYRPPFDPRNEIEGMVSKILASGMNPGSEALASLFSSPSQDAASTSRLYQMIYEGRSDLSSWASATSQSQASFLDRKLTDQMLASIHAETSQAAVDPHDHNSFYDYAAGRFTDC